MDQLSKLYSGAKFDSKISDEIFIIFSHLFSGFIFTISVCVSFFYTNYKDVVETYTFLSKYQYSFVDYIVIFSILYLIGFVCIDFIYTILDIIFSKAINILFVFNKKYNILFEIKLFRRFVKRYKSTEKFFLAFSERIFFNNSYLFDQKYKRVVLKTFKKTFGNNLDNYDLYRLAYRLISELESVKGIRYRYELKIYQSIIAGLTIIAFGFMFHNKLLFGLILIYLMLFVNFRISMIKEQFRLKIVDTAYLYIKRIVKI